jgi:hypothetical protein
LRFLTLIARKSFRKASRISCVTCFDSSAIWCSYNLFRRYNLDTISRHPSGRFSPSRLRADGFRLTLDRASLRYISAFASSRRHLSGDACFACRSSRSARCFSSHADNRRGFGLNSCGLRSNTKRLRFPASKGRGLDDATDRSASGTADKGGKGRLLGTIRLLSAGLKPAGLKQWINRRVCDGGVNRALSHPTSGRAKTSGRATGQSTKGIRRKAEKVLGRHQAASENATHGLRRDPGLRKVVSRLFKDAVVCSLTTRRHVFGRAFRLNPLANTSGKVAKLRRLETARLRRTTSRLNRSRLTHDADQVSARTSTPEVLPEGHLVASRATEAKIDGGRIGRSRKVRLSPLPLLFLFRDSQGPTVKDRQNHVLGTPEIGQDAIGHYWNHQGGA